MKKKIWQGVITCLLLSLLSLMTNTVSHVSAQEKTEEEMRTVSITNPTDGETVSGMLIITGTVDFFDFLKYEIFLQANGDLSWVATGYAPVIKGNMVRLDSRLFIDGTYQLLVRQVNSDSNYTDYLGPTITIDNNQGGPRLSPEIESSLLYPPAQGAVFRIKNCSGHNLEFDYKSPQGFCSAQDLWLDFKPEDQDFCPTVDVQLIAECEYRGTAVGEGQPEGATYSFEAEKGKIYQFIYAGDGRYFLGEIEGDARAETDTGGQKRDEVYGMPASAKTTSDMLLPISGRGRASNLYAIGLAFSLILLLIAGGVIAVRKQH